MSRSKRKGPWMIERFRLMLTVSSRGPGVKLGGLVVFPLLCEVHIGWDGVPCHLAIYTSNRLFFRGLTLARSDQGRPVPWMRRRSGDRTVRFPY
jgi:hypothetical protein